MEESLHLTSPFTQAIDQNNHHSLSSHLPFHHSPPPPSTPPITHPLIQRSRQKAKLAHRTSPHLHSEIVFPRFTVDELKLGKVLGRGGFGTVLEVRGFDLHHQYHHHHEKEESIRQVKSLDALGDHHEVVATRSEEMKRKRRSVSLGFGQRHDFFRRRRGGGHDEECDTGCEGGDLEARQMEEEPSEMNRHEEKKMAENPPAEAAVVTAHKSERATQQRPSLNFSFLSWRDSKPGHEGQNAINESDWHSLTYEYVDETTTPVLEPEMEEEEKISEDKAQDDEPETIQTTSPKNNVPSRRRIILFNNRNTNSQHNNLLPPNLLQDKHYMAQHATTSTGKSRYAIKIISPHILHDTKKYLQACADMATETYFFSILHHENIVQLRAVGQDDMFSPSYFLIMDRLYDTLLQRIEGVWRQKMDRLENDFWVWNRGKKCSGFWMERLGVGRSLAGALGYLHDLGIIYRDLKPENVGFDSKGIPKLFDFGLAKQVNPKDATDGTYRLTAATGSLRYMAPEVGNGWPYNFNADSYSFTILLWEILALDMPFRHYTAQEIVNMVRKWGERPKLKEEWSDRLKECMCNGWDSNFRKRPTMKDFETILDLELHDLQTS